MSVMDVVTDAIALGYARQKAVVIGKDGLRYCAKCGKPLETVIDTPLLGRRAYPIMCECDHIEEQKARARAAYEEHERKRKLCFGSFAYGLMDARFANDNGAHPDISRKCANYCRHFDTMLKTNQGLLFYGGVGTGKSFMAACIANELIDNGYTAYMTTVSAIERQTAAFLKEERNEFVESLMTYDLLIVDDLGVERQTEYMQELTYEVINNRYVSERPLIITTNVDIERIKNPATAFEKRLFDRVLEACSFPLHVDGQSQRRANVLQRYKTASELLNE